MAYLNSQTSASWCNLSCLLMSTSQPSLEHFTAAKPHILTWRSRSLNFITSRQPRLKKSQRILSSDKYSITILGAWTNVSSVSSSRHVGQLWVFLRCLLIHALQKWCWLFRHITGLLRTFIHIGQWKLGLIGSLSSKRLSSKPCPSHISLPSWPSIRPVMLGTRLAIIPLYFRLFCHILKQVY
jgi:hypothetical protein